MVQAVWSIRAEGSNDRSVSPSGSRPVIVTTADRPLGTVTSPPTVWVGPSAAARNWRGPLMAAPLVPPGRFATTSPRGSRGARPAMFGPITYAGPEHVFGVHVLSIR